MIANHLRFWWVYAPLVFALAGCGVAPPVGEQAPAGSFPSEESTPSRALSMPQGNPAVLALLNNAEAQEQAGQFEQAAAALERALRLEPRNAMLWHRLARLRLSQGQWQTAVDLAAKSNSLAGGNGDLQARNWQVIAVAKERQGDRDGAREARARVEADGAVR
jgi:predicted Zn-dependent protease